MVSYRIFPAIGIARIGGDEDFFLGPERVGEGPIEPASGAKATRFKSADGKLIRKQGARFHLFESTDGVAWTPAKLPIDATVEWSVVLANTKAAAERPSVPPIKATRPVMAAGSEGMAIVSAKTTITGAGQSSAALGGVFETIGPTGQPFIVEVKLGQLRTDDQGRLIVTGGDGISGAPAGMAVGPSFYNNEKWFDDVADGPVTAKVMLAGGATQDAEGGAWVIIGPPDYAPNIGGIVTLFDIVREKGNAPIPEVPSFAAEILPIIQRTRRHRWVNGKSNWSHSDIDVPNLGNNAAAHKTARANALEIIKEAEKILDGHIDENGPPFQLTTGQKAMLDAWVQGDFNMSPLDIPALSGSGLTRASLEGAVGQGFCPGIEAGILVEDRSIYLEPFDYRIDHGEIAAGDLTALMAQPWQADFYDCAGSWWPAQRPDEAPQSDDFDDTKEWVRDVNSQSDMVEKFQLLGFILKQGDDEVYIESERATPFVA
ncbi:LodA/GoxA family CTQ-dependent oxidase [Mesorhizobium sp. M0871]|uniref:LodA/GoxA family CTQ-dependent oxidase n=1 Tax=Mesorhizobium sp. M0871 TaxID=2957017 RepID=UPI00333750BF